MARPPLLARVIESFLKGEMSPDEVMTFGGASGVLASIFPDLTRLPTLVWAPAVNRNLVEDDGAFANGI